jgi:hypothetical protein
MVSLILDPSLGPQMKRVFKKYLIFPSLFFLTSYPAFSAPIPDGWAKRACRTTLRFVVDPIELVVRGGREIFKGDWARVFDETKYRAYVELERKESRGNLGEEISTEWFLARTDSLFDRVGYHDLVTSGSRFPNSIETRDFLSEVRKILKKDKPIREKDLRNLSRLYYAVSRKLPYESVESLLRLPRSTKAALIEYQGEALFLRMAFADVLSSFGIKSEAARSGVREKIRRAFSMGLVGAAKALSWTNAETGLTRLARSDVFWNDVLSLGYTEAVRKGLPGLLGPRANLETFLAITGGIYSIYGMIELVAYLNEKEPLPVGVLENEVRGDARDLPAETIRNSLIERWKNVQTSQYGEEIDPDDLKTIQTYYDTLNVDVLRRTYSAMLNEPKPR